MTRRKKIYNMITLDLLKKIPRICKSKPIIIAWTTCTIPIYYKTNMNTISRTKPQNSHPKRSNINSFTLIIVVAYSAIEQVLL